MYLCSWKGFLSGKEITFVNGYNYIRIQKAVVLFEKRSKISYFKDTTPSFFFFA